MDNYELLQTAAKNISKLIRLEKAWREGQIEVGDETPLIFDEALKTRLKQQFASIRTEVITALNSITP